MNYVHIGNSQKKQSPYTAKYIFVLVAHPQQSDVMTSGTMIALSHSCLLLSLGQNSFLHLPSTRKSVLIVLLLLIKYHSDEKMMMVMMMVIMMVILLRLPPPSRPLLLCHQRWTWAYHIQQRTQIINMKTR